MLTTEILNANSALSGLSDDIKAAIVEMSRNDEAATIGQRVGEIYGGLDADILATSGVSKEGTEKTYDYAKRVISGIRSQMEESQSKVAELTKENARLQKALQDGGSDAETKKLLSKATADLANVTKEYTELKSKYDASEAKHQEEIFGITLAGELDKAASGIKFKSEYPANIASLLKEQALEKVKKMNPEYIDDGNGGKVLAFSQDGTLMRNPDNNLRPFTATELVERELRAMGVLDEGRKQTGAGSPPVAPREGQPTASSVDLAGARTQDEAHEIIARQLMAQGKINGSKDFADAMQKAWKDNKDFIKSLPVR